MQLLQTLILFALKPVVFSVVVTLQNIGKTRSGFEAIPRHCHLPIDDPLRNLRTLNSQSLNHVECF